MKNKSSLVRFDWAIKRLLRQKSNFVVIHPSRGKRDYCPHPRKRR